MTLIFLRHVSDNNTQYLNGLERLIHKSPIYKKYSRIFRRTSWNNSIFGNLKSFCYFYNNRTRNYRCVLRKKEKKIHISQHVVCAEAPIYKTGPRVMGVWCVVVIWEQIGRQIKRAGENIIVVNSQNPLKG